MSVYLVFLAFGLQSGCLSELLKNCYNSKKYSIVIILQVSIAVQIVISHGQSCCSRGHVVILLDCQMEILRVSGHYDTSFT